MSFTTEVKYLHSIGRDITKLSSSLTPSLISNFNKLNSIDMSKTDEIVTSVKTLQKASTNIKDVLTGLDSIDNVLKIQNQVQYVSDIRDSIGVIAGSIDEIKVAADYANVFGGVAAMKPMIDDVLKLSVKMDLVLDLEEKMDAMVEAEARLNAKLEEMKIIEEKTSRVSTLVADILNRINIKEHRINESLSRMEDIFTSMNEFHVKVNHVGSGESAKAGYDRTKNRLDLNIPMGKAGPRGNYKGDKGDPGKSGSNFAPSYMGNIVDRNRFNSHAPGTSFLSLDEIPTMIYFRKSNTMGDWTDGQPFGVSNGGYSDEDKGVDIVDGINIDELTKHILINMKRREDGSTNGS